MNVLFRKPAFPVLLLQDKKLLPYVSFDDLSKYLSKLNNTNDKIIIYDSNGDEFWYMKNNDVYVLIPGFLTQKIKKKELIDLYNNTEVGQLNPFKKNISNITLRNLVINISDNLLLK